MTLIGAVRCRNPVRARASPGFFDDGEHLLTVALHFIVISFFLLPTGNRSLCFIFHFVVRQGIEGRMLCRIKHE